MANTGFIGEKSKDYNVVIPSINPVTKIVLDNIIISGTVLKNLRWYIKHNNILDGRGKLMSPRNAIGTIVTNFHDDVIVHERSKFSFDDENEHLLRQHFGDGDIP